ncbi:SDR family NAD(P)-dependent oxidoreductase [Hyphomonas johnsonii]|uniref:Short-chain dehydrogenase n=1 Tax=Hyphomonas johnsonii MHS-2 TaxID=1280950 RepID=A0A059FRV0_9PROT|nr:SDR family NAD(P)-dependent oxidoreductase [Hyphomonas johnsonii]KCZ93241.1 short-chain dehydrogenase [Hyphomonas johnsonii MHS-2]
MGILNGKVAIITGGGGGLGRAYAHAFAREGAKIVVNDYGVASDGGAPISTSADKVVEEIRAAGGEAVANAADVGTVEGGASILQSAMEAFGGVDILINNAGILRDRTLAKMDEKDWDDVMHVHLKGTFCVTRPVFTQMKAQARGGVIVNTSSTSGLQGKFGQGNYGAAKGGVWGFSNTLTLEGERYGIRVWTLAPAADTRLTAAVTNEDYKAVYTPDKVAEVVLYMVSDLSAPQTGKTIVAGGGIVREVRLENGPGYVPTPDFSAHDLAEAVESGKVMLPTRQAKSLMAID